MRNAVDTMIDFFLSIENFEPGHIEYLKKNTVSRKLRRSSYYLMSGELTDRLAYVASGLFRFSYCDNGGNDYTAWFAGENSFIPSFAAVATANASRFSIEALEDSEVAEFPIAVLAELETRSGSARKITRHFMLKALLEKERREASLILDDALTRYLDFKNNFAHLESRLKQHHVASYLGISPVSLSRIRKKMKLTQVNA